nr:MAG TPA: hypothetical protein [Caudoviricetes sp.]
MKRMTIKGFKLGWDSSKLLPSYVGLYERLDKIENILGDDYDLDRLTELVKVDRKEQEYMNIDEAIEHAKEISVTCENNKCALEHSQLAEWLIQLKSLKSIISDNQDIIQLKNLINADKEGKCVILPVKIGDFVYMPLLGKILRLEIVEINAKNYIPVFKAGNAGLVFSFNEDDIGKGVFLTREEAEQALKERKQNEKIK